MEVATMINTNDNYILWRDVVGYEGIYEVSNNGQVRTVSGKKTHSTRHGTRVWKQRVLKQKISQDNTCRVALYKDKKQKTFQVHRLVAYAFIPMIDGKDYINHKDGSRLNNNVSNLEWCDHDENNNHAFDNGLIQTCQSIKLIDIETGESFEFRSMAKAGRFLGRNNGYVSSLLKRNKTEIDGYKIVIGQSTV